MTAANIRLPIPLVQALLVVSVLAAWEFVPQIEWMSAFSPVFDPFFVSSPSRIAQTLALLLSGERETPLLWSFAFPTLLAALIGTALGMTTGAAMGLLLSNVEWLSVALRPFIIAVNAAPRIALIPILVIILGPTLGAAVMTAVLVVFFIVFFNAYEGGTSVPLHVLHNAQLLGASRWNLMRHVRLPYVLVWTLASLPNALSFGLVSVVTAEIFTGTLGFGRVLMVAMNSVNSSLTFAVVFVLSIMGVLLVVGAEVLKRRWLHWWVQGRAGG